MLAVLVGLSAGTLAQSADASSGGAAEAVDVPQVDPQLVISRESLIASMTEPGGHQPLAVRDADSAAAKAGGGGGTNTEQYAGSQPAGDGGRTEVRNGPLPVETALAAVGAIVEVTPPEPRQAATLQAHEQQHQQQTSQQQPQPAAASDLPLGAAQAAQPAIEQPLTEQHSDAQTLASAASAERQVSGQASEPQDPGLAKRTDPGEEDADEDDRELNSGAGGGPPVRWLDCQVGLGRLLGRFTHVTC